MLVDDTSKIYVGETEVEKVYQGTDIIYQKETPTPYTELLYIESTGTQYIDTLISGNGLGEYEIVFDPLDTYLTSWEQYFGGVQDTTGYTPKIFLGAPDVVVQQGSTIDVHIGQVGGGILNASVTSAGVYCNDVLYSSYTPSPWGPSSFYIFTAHGESNLKATMRLYSLKMYTDGVKVRDYIPVLDENNVPCLYDKVSQTYFYNEGTGTFLYETLSPSYTELAYIQSTGTQYIDTGYKPNGNTKVKFQYSDYSSSVDGVMFGAYGSSWETNSFGLYANSTTSVWGYWLHYCSNTRVAGVTWTKYNAIIEVDKGNVNIDDVRMLTVPTLSFTSPSNMYIFNGNGFSSANQPSVYKLHYFKIWDNDTLVRDYIPVLDNHNVPCLYDKVNETYYYNAGSGTFLYALPQPVTTWYTNSTSYGAVSKAQASFGGGRWGDDRDYASYTTGDKVNTIRIYLAEAGTGEVGVFNTSTRTLISSTTVTFTGTPSSSEMQEFDLGTTFTLAENEIMYVGNTGTAKFWHWAGGSGSPQPPSSYFWDSIGNNSGRRLYISANLLVDFGYKE